MLTARINDWGFAVSADSTDAERSPDGRWRLVYVDGVKEPLQFTTVTVLAEGQSSVEHQIVVIRANEAEPQSVVDAVALCFPLHVSVAIRQDAVGWARATCAESASHEVVVAAVGIVKASGGWDESTPIIVELGGGQFEVFMQFCDKRWQARVQRSR